MRSRQAPCLLACSFNQGRSVGLAVSASPFTRQEPVLQQIVVASAPERDFALAALLSKAQALQQGDRGHVVLMNLGLHTVELHALTETPVECRRQRLAHQAPARQLGRHLVAQSALLPASVPGEQAAAADQAGLGFFQLQAPAHTGVGQLPPTGEGGNGSLGLAQIRQWVGAKPGHMARIAVDAEQVLGVGLGDFAEDEARGLEEGEVGHVVFSNLGPSQAACETASWAAGGRVAPRAKRPGTSNLRSDSRGYAHGKKLGCRPVPSLQSSQKFISI